MLSRLTGVTPTRILTTLAVILWCAALPAADLGLPAARSVESVGFTSARLPRIDAYLQRTIAAGQYAGATWLVARDGQVVTHGAAGWSDVATRTAMTEDTAFAIASMTKLVTTVTVLSLLEEGRFNLEDPVALYLPELANLQVFVGGTAAAPVLQPAVRPVTIRHLLTHTSGFSGYFDMEPLTTLYNSADLWASHTLGEFTAKAARRPLLFQPGEGWNYGISTDLLGALIEKLTGQTLAEAMRVRVFAPLGMNHTGFTPPPDLVLAKLHGHDAAGRLIVVAGPPIPRPPEGIFSGGGGLYSTLHDYARFAQMLLNDGELGGVRVLGRKSVELMRSNHVEYLNPRPKNRWVPPGFGFGVRVRRDRADEADSLGSPGQFGWEGILTSYVSIDPHERMFVLLLMQHQPYDEGGVFEKFANTVYQALEK